MVFRISLIMVWFRSGWVGCFAEFLFFKWFGLGVVSCGFSWVCSCCYSLIWWCSCFFFSCRFDVHILWCSCSLILGLMLIGKQKNKPNSCSSKKSSRANRAVWTKNHPRRDSTWTNTTLKSVKVVHNNRPCSSSMDDLQMSMDDQNLLRPDRRIHNTWRNFKCCNSY